MSVLTPWLDRRFPGGYPADLGPNVLARLRGGPARLAETLAGVSRERCTFHDEGTWSIAEHAGHLSDLEPLWFGRVGDILEGVSPMRPWEVTNEKTHRAGHDDSEPAELIETFRDLRALLVARCSDLSEEELGRASLHPRLEVDLRLVDLLVFVCEHDDHHLARIHELGQG